MCLKRSLRKLNWTKILAFFLVCLFCTPHPPSFLKSNIAILNRKACTDLYPKCAINPGSKMRDKYSKLIIMSYTSKPKKRKKWGGGGGGEEIQSFSGSFGPYFYNLFEWNPRLFQRWAEQGHLQPPSGSCDCKGAFYFIFLSFFFFFLRLPLHITSSSPVARPALGVERSSGAPYWAFAPPDSSSPKLLPPPLITHSWGL